MVDFRYPHVKEWFLLTYPEVEQFGSPAAEKSAATPEAAQNPATETPEVVQLPTAEEPLKAAG